MIKKKLNNKIKQFKDIISGEKIYIYQMGKVASSSIEDSLKGEAIHMHSLYKGWNKKIYNTKYNTGHNKLWVKIFYENFLQSLELKILRNTFRKQQSKKIITMVRDPIARNISFLFQFSPIVLYKMYCEQGGREEMNEKDTISFYINEFYENIWHTSGVEWFDYEFLKTTGIDIYSHPFNKQEGFGLIIEKNTEILILKAESIEKNYEIIKKFLGKKNFQLKDSNIGEKKFYKSLYGQFKTSFKPDVHYVNKLYTSKFMNHFYTENEILEFKNKWLS